MTGMMAVTRACFCGALCFVSAAAYGDARNFQATWVRALGGTQTADYRIYTPSAIDAPRVKGVVFLYPGSGGDWRFRAYDTVWQEAARSLGFALVGAGSNAGYMSISEADARSSLTAILAAAAAATGRRGEAGLGVRRQRQGCGTNRGDRHAGPARVLDARRERLGFSILEPSALLSRGVCRRDGPERLDNHRYAVPFKCGTRRE